MMLRVLVAVAASFILLSACDQPQSGTVPPTRPMPVAAPPGEPPPFDYEAYKRDPAAMTEPQVVGYIADRTRMVHGSGHGTQISYGKPDGTTCLWYPGNAVVLPGQWMTKAVTGPLRGREQTVISLCYKYGPNTYNPVTGSSGGDWNCLPAGIWLMSLVESRKGDIFGLSRSAAPPFVLPREKMTLDELLKRAAATRGRG
jgi:hypothetical protein